MYRTLGRALQAATLLSMAAVSTAWAQDPQTRAEDLRARREAKSQELSPHVPDGLERAMHFIEGTAIPVLVRDGFYARLGSLSPGSGLAYGAGYRNSRIVGLGGRFDGWVAASLKRYWAMAAQVTYPDLADGHLMATAYARRHDYTFEEFTGVGPQTDRIDRSSVRLRRTTVGGWVAIRPVNEFRVGGGLEYLRPRSGDGLSDDLPVVSERFSPGQAPGLAAEPNYVRALGFVEVDYRQPLNARKGGFYRLDVSHYADGDGGAFSFTRADLDLRQYVSFLAERRVLVGRVLLSTTETDSGSEVPFYLMPSLGGHTDLRGFRANRFRGRHAMLLQGEYRWEIWAGFEGALFYDAGKVANRRADLSFDDLESAYGIGFRFNTDNGVIMRIDTAFGSRDGVHFYMVFGGLF